MRFCPWDLAWNGVVPLFLFLIAPIDFASGFEAGASNQYPPCLLCGYMTAALPPAGWYFEDTMLYEHLTAYNNRSERTTTRYSIWANITKVIWIADFPLLGANWGASLSQPIAYGDVKIAESGVKRWGMTDTAIVPAYLSWNLGSDLFVAAGFGVYIPDGSFNKQRALNVGDEFWTVEPVAAVTYLPDGWNLSLSATVDFNTRNAARQTTSGNVLYVDYTIEREILGWEIGISGDWLQQLTHDQGPWSRADEQQIVIGPVIGHMIGNVDVQLIYVHDLISRNTGGGDNLTLRFRGPF